MPPGVKKAPLCARCKNHGIRSSVKGHKRHCRFRDCCCLKCELTKEHQRVVANQVKIKRQQEQDTRLGINNTAEAMTSSYSFNSLVEACQADPTMAAKALLMFYGNTNNVVTKLLQFKDEDIRFQLNH